MQQKNWNTIATNRIRNAPGEALLEQREQNHLSALFFNAKMIRRVGTAILQKEEEVRL